MFGILISIVHLLVTLNALVRSFSSRFWVGAIAGVLRAVLMVVGIIVGFRLSFPGSEGPPPGPALIALVVAVLGPVVSFGTLFVAHWRASNVPARDEERMGRPFMAWLPVALLDAAFVVIAIVARVISNPW